MTNEERKERDLKNYAAFVSGSEAVDFSFMPLDYYDKEIERLRNECKEIEKSNLTNKQKLDELKSKKKNIRLVYTRKEYASQVARQLKILSSDYCKFKRDELPFDVERQKDKLIDEYNKFMKMNPVSPMSKKEIENFAQTFRKDRKTLSDQLQRCKDNMMKEMDKSKNVSKVYEPIHAVTLPNGTKLYKYKEIGFDNILDYVSKKINKKEDEKEKEPFVSEISNISEIGKINKLNGFNKNINFTMKENGELRKMLEIYEEAQIHINFAKKAEELLYELDHNYSYSESYEDLLSFRDNELKIAENLKNKAVNVNSNLNIDKLYNEHKDIDNKVSMDELDPSVAEERINEQARREEERKQELEEMTAIGNEYRIKQLDEFINSDENEHLITASTSSRIQYAVEKVKKSKLGELKFSDYLKEKQPDNKDLIAFQESREQRDQLIYDEYIDKGLGCSVADYAKKQYSIEDFDIDNVDVIVKEDVNQMIR